jgi:hypothetical protein
LATPFFAGGMSCYNTAPERLNAVETRAICDVPIDSEALGSPVDPVTGLLRPDILRKNMLWVLDEVLLRLKGEEFCGHEVCAVKSLLVACEGACEGTCNCTFGFITGEERVAMCTFYKASEEARASWPDQHQREEFQRLIRFLDDSTHCLRCWYSLEMRACHDAACVHGCVDRFKLARRNPGLAGACCKHEDCGEPFIGTAQFSSEPGHYQSVEDRAANDEHPPSSPEALDR